MKRKLFGSAILLLCFGTSSLIIYAQRLDSQTPFSSLVEIDRFDWYAQSEIGEPRFGKNSYRQSRPEGKTANIPTDDLSESPKPEKFVYRVRIRNLTGREISSVVWRYRFVNPLTDALSASLQFKTDVRIKPYRRKTLYAESPSPPASTVDVKLLEFNSKRPFRETVVVESLVFAGGAERKKGGKK